MKNILAAVFILSIACVSAIGAGAQSPAPSASASPGSETPANGAFWSCDLTGGRYVVALRAITSISSQEFLVDGAARVTEVDIATTGSEIARFYFVEPVTPTVPSSGGQAALDHLQSVVHDLSIQAGQSGAMEEVIKSYPTSTHAHTVEYRLQSKGEVTQILSSVERAWKSGRGVNLAVGGS